MTRTIIQFALILGIINTILSVTKLAQKEILGMPLGGWFWLFRYYWRGVVLIAVWGTYTGLWRLPGVAPIISAFAYEGYVLFMMPLERVHTPQSRSTVWTKASLFCIVPVVQLVFILLQM